jgi:hypothetical protein
LEQEHGKTIDGNKAVSCSAGLVSFAERTSTQPVLALSPNESIGEEWPG